MEADARPAPNAVTLLKKKGGKPRWFKKRREYDLPLVDPKAIEAYLARDFNDYSFLKAAPKEELRAHANELGFRYITEPRINQLVCNIIAAQEPRFLFYLDMGAGKSKERIDYVRFMKRSGHLQRALICVPEYVHIDSWEEQLREHGPDLRYVKLLGDKEERFDLIDKKADVYLINYAGLPVYMSKKKKKAAGKTKKGVDAEWAAEFASLFNIVHMDEIHRFSSHESLTFRLLCWLMAGAPIGTASTGTPFGRDPMMLWPQFKIMDDGETLGTLGMFRTVFFESKKRYFGGYDYTFKDGEEGRENMLPELHQVIKNKSIIYEDHELPDQPAVTRLKVPVRMSAEQRMFYDRITERMKETKGDFRSLDNIFTRFRQCASGFLSLKDDDESRVEVQITPNPKLGALEQVVLDMPSSEKFLIFYHYHYSGIRIRALLDKMKIQWATLYGRSRMAADGLKQEGQYESFLQERRKRAFVLQDQAGSEAINPHHVCRYAWFYERPDSPIISQQAEKRVNRPGQKGHVIIGDLVMLDTMEEKLLGYVQEAKDLRKAVLSGEERL